MQRKLVTSLIPQTLRDRTGERIRRRRRTPSPQTLRDRTGERIRRRRRTPSPQTLRDRTGERIRRRRRTPSPQTLRDRTGERIRRRRRTPSPQTLRDRTGEVSNFIRVFLPIHVILRDCYVLSRDTSDGGPKIDSGRFLYVSSGGPGGRLCNQAETAHALANKVTPRMTRVQLAVPGIIHLPLSQGMIRVHK